MTAADRRAARLLATGLAVLGVMLTVAALAGPFAGSLIFPVSAAAGMLTLAALAPGRPRRTRTCSGACTREGHRQMTRTQ